MKTNKDKTKQLTEDQVNLICATFMDISYRVEFKTSTSQYVTDNWCNSLDGLVSIWDKLGGEFWLNFKRSDLPKHNLTLWRGRSGENRIMGNGISIQQAAAHAAALAILEIKPELKELL